MPVLQTSVRINNMRLFSFAALSAAVVSSASTKSASHGYPLRLRAVNVFKSPCHRPTWPVPADPPVHVESLLKCFPVNAAANPLPVSAGSIIKSDLVAAIERGVSGYRYLRLLRVRLRDGF